MADKIFNKLPGVLQTDAVKNFFESTVDQLYSKANVEVVKGYLGTKTSFDASLNGAWISEPDVVRAEYSISPAVNTTNSQTGVTENLIYFDEYIQLLKNHGLNTADQNKIFNSNFQSFIPPVDLDKIINYQEYYWYPDGPTAITVEGSANNPIDVVNDILGKTSFTPINGKPFRNGMVIKFGGDYVIPQSYISTEYIVQGVGSSIILVNKKDNFSTRYSTAELGQWDATAFVVTNVNVVYSASNVSSVTINNPGVGYVNPTVTLSNTTGTYSNVATATATANVNGSITNVTVTNSNVSHLYTGDISIQISDTGADANIIESVTFGSQSEVTVKNVALDSLSDVKVGQLAIFDSVTGIVQSVNQDSITEIAFTGESNVRLPGSYANVASTGGGGSGATFDVYVDSGIATVSNINGANTNRVANTYLSVSPEWVREFLSNAEIEASVGGTIVGSYSNTTTSYEVNDIVEYNGYYYRQLQHLDPSNPDPTDVGYINTNPDWPVNPTTDSNSTKYWQIVPHYVESPGIGATFDIIIDALGNATSVVANVTGDGYSVGERVSIDVADLGAANSYFTGDLVFDVASVTGNVTSIAVNQPGTGYSIASTVSIADSLLGNTISNALVFSTSQITDTVSLTEATTISNANLLVHFEGTGFTGSVLTDNYTFATDANGNVTVSILSSQAISGIDPNNPNNYYLQGGVYSWDKDTDGDGEGDANWGGSLTQKEQDYLTLARGSTNKNIWSRVNFWYHRDNFVDAGNNVPTSSVQAKRPILEFDKDIELLDHGINSRGTVFLSAGDNLISKFDGMSSNVFIDSVAIASGATIVFPNEIIENSQYVYRLDVDVTTNTINVSKLLDSTDPSGFFKLQHGDTISITAGSLGIGKEYYFDNTKGLVLAQEKININQAPLFKVYDDQKNYLGDESVYYRNDFAGNKLFGFTPGTGSNDTEYGFPLAFKQFKNSSEISYSNFLNTTYNYRPQGTSSTQPIAGNYYYKLLKAVPEYHRLFKNSNKLSDQKIVSRYTYSRNDVDSFVDTFSIGCVPNVSTTNSSGYNITVTVNGKIRTDWQYESTGKIKFNDSLKLNHNDLIDIECYSNTGIIESTTSSSVYEIPITWHKNYLNEEISTIAEPEYLPHFKELMENQIDFSGDALKGNNYDNTLKEARFGKKIIQSSENLMLSAFLIDDQPYNLLNSLDFVGREYSRYKRRFLKELDNYYDLVDFDALSNNEILEKVLRNVISYSVGKNVFNQTYMLPFGDNYNIEQKVIADTAQKVYTTEISLDTDKIENALLVYNDLVLLTIDDQYTITNKSPITITLSNSYTPVLGTTLDIKIYNKDRDSAQCPPTPSAMGMHPLTKPEKITDTTFRTPISVIQGHDGSKIPAYGDRRDDIVLEFEKRIFNNTKNQFRDTNSLPDLNVTEIRPGHFRQNITVQDWYDLLNNDFEDWLLDNNANPTVNDFYNELDEWTWNYRGDTNVPGHWRGWYTYHYDTVRPHTHPWEMLGFFEKPTWWDTQYLSVTYTNYGSNNLPMWKDLEQGIIRRGTRANVENDAFKHNNPFRRIGLLDILPVDSNANKLTPKVITNTGSTTKTTVYANTTQDNTQGYVTTSYKLTDGLNIYYDNNNVYILSSSIPNYDITKIDTENGEKPVRNVSATYNVPRVSLSGVTSAPEQLGDVTVAVTVTGLPLYNTKNTTSYNSDGVWNYNSGYQERTNRLNGILAHTNNDGLVHTHVPTSDMFDSTTWGNSSSHSGIIGWAFDGLPIYGPYGYTEYYANGQVKNNTITNVKSSYELRTGLRNSGPGGAYTGLFVEDYTWNNALSSTPGYADRYNTRYGVTPDSPTTPIRYYVATISDTNENMFPYVVGGGANDSGNHPAVVWGNKSYASVQDKATNSLYVATVDNNSTQAISSVATTTYSKTTAVSNQWKFGDGAPVENAWKYSSRYPYALCQALFLRKPGLFSILFANPPGITKPIANNKTYISVNTRKHWNMFDRTDFPIHGTTDSSGNLITTTGYTQFINSYIKFQTLDMTTDFSDLLDTLSIKLSHRMAGFIDKDTMILSLDQYSTTGESRNLILPSTNIGVTVHNSPYKSRNTYSGVIIEKTETGFTVKGYDKHRGYFEVLESDKNKGRERINVGGDPIEWTDWLQEISYPEGTIVKYKQIFYQAKNDVPSSETFIFGLWKKLPGLPTLNAGQGTIYQQTTGNINRVYYGYEFTSVDDVFDFLISLGRYQTMAGYNFNEYDLGLTRPSDWRYAAESFLFWTTGKWEIGNSLELSPMAKQVRFASTSGYVAEIKKSINNHFSIVDREGKAINPQDCSILRIDNKVEIIPPAGVDIYGITLYTRETEHAVTIDNTTDFADTVYNSLLDHKHERLKIKASRTANWDGRFLSEGFIINNDELIPNLDNVVETTGRYYELGFVPVDKQIYEKSRQQFGYNERDYLNELDINDDQQFDFYKGMIQSKGTKSSLSRIGRSNAIIQGNMDIFDEWAFKIGEFGDVQNDQSIELKIEKQDVVQDPQLVTLSFPEDTTGTVDKITVLEPRHQYFNVPEISISAPTKKNGIQAKAVATLNSSGYLNTISVTNPGAGYEGTVGVSIILGNLFVSNTTEIFNAVDAVSTAVITDEEYFSGNNLINSSYVGNANITSLGNITISDNLNGNGNIEFSLSSITDVSNISTLINEEASLNASITAYTIINDIADPGDSGGNIAPTYRENKLLRITGSDFTLSGPGLANLNLASGRYQPRQRYAIDTANNTVASNISVTINGSTIAYNNGYNWAYLQGERWQINNPTFISGNVAYSLNLNTGLIQENTTINSNNLVTRNGTHDFVKVYINGIQLRAHEDLYTANASAITFTDVGLLPNGKLDPGANVYVVETGTVELDEANVVTDLPGSELNIKVATNDAIAITLGEKRIYEITPDAKDDEVILIDIDDTSRFLKKPEGVRESNLWPTTAEVSYTGITANRYNPIPNAGYVNRANVDYQAFSYVDIRDLFGSAVKFTPSANDHIHVGKSENNDWNVYKLQQSNATLSFVEKESNFETAYLYTDYSLFNYVDSNQLQENDLSRYLDYHLVLKNGGVSDEFVVWTNEQIVSKKSVRISNFGGVNMVESNVVSIGPKPTSVISISNVLPAPTTSVSASALQADGNGIVAVTAKVNNLIDGDLVTFYSPQTDEYTFAPISTDYVTDVTSNVLTNASLFARTLVFAQNDDYIYHELKYSGNSVVIDLPQIESDAFDSNNNADTLINSANLVLPEDYVGSTSTGVTFTRVKHDEIKFTVANVNVYGSDIVYENVQVRLETANSTYSNVVFPVSNVDTANNTITIQAPTFSDDDGNIVNIASWGVSNIHVINPNALHGQDHTVSNVTTAGFTIEQANVTANVDYGNLNYTFYGKTRFVTSTDHGLYSGDMVKLEANAYSGYYYVESTNNNSFVIRRPFNQSVASGIIASGGNVITKGIVITTDNDHGIHKTYADGGKRIAVHFAEPRMYNQLYQVSSVTANTIVVDNAFAFKSSNSIMSQPWQSGTFYDFGSRVKDNDIVYTAVEAHTSGLTISNVYFKPIGETAVTTVDHNKITLNNATIAIDNLNSEEAIVESFNRQMAIRRGFIKSDQFTMSMMMLKKAQTAVQQAIGTGPYVTNLSGIGHNLINVGQINIPAGISSQQGFAKTGTISKTLNLLQGASSALASSMSTNTAITPTNPINDPKIAAAAQAQVDPNNQLTFGHGSGSSTNAGGAQSRFGQLLGAVQGQLTGNPPVIKVPTVQPNNSTIIGGTPTTGGSPTTNTGSGTPIIDPTKALNALESKICGPSQCIPQPAAGGGSTGGPGTNGGNTELECFGSSLTWSGWTGNGKGDRTWGSKWSGYYYLTGNQLNQFTQVGGNGGNGEGLVPKALGGAITWSDNGSTNTFSTNVTFGKGGTFYVHALQYGRQAYDTTWIQVTGAGTIVPTNRVKGTWLGTNINLNNAIYGNTIKVTVSAGDTITISGQTKGGSNYWHAVAFHLSTMASGFQVCAEKPVQANNPIGNSPGANNVTREYVQQSTTTWDIDDQWYYQCKFAGMTRLVFDMYSGADGIVVYQGFSRGSENRVVCSTIGANITRASTQDKTDLVSASSPTVNTVNVNPGLGGIPGGINVPGTNSGTWTTANTNLPDFELSPGSSRSNEGLQCGVKNCGQISWYHDPAQGEFIKVYVYKDSSVYRYFIDLPKAPPPPPENEGETQPEVGFSCDVPASNGSGDPTGGGANTGKATNPGTGNGNKGGSSNGGSGSTGSGVTGIITEVVIDDPGIRILTSGVVIIPAPDVDGTGADFAITRNAAGEVTNVRIVSGGTKYKVGDEFFVDENSPSFNYPELAVFRVTAVATSGAGNTNSGSNYGSTGSQTPISQPGGQPGTTSVTSNATNRYTQLINQVIRSGTNTNGGAGAKYGSGGGSPHTKGGNLIKRNYSGWGQPSMAGYFMIPTRLRKNAQGVPYELPDGTIGKKTTKQVFGNSYGKYRPLDTNRYVNTTVQRVTGGEVIPLAKPLGNRIPFAPNPLSTTELVNYPGTNYFGTGPRGFYRAGSTIDYRPSRISETADIYIPGSETPGRTIRNILNDDYTLTSTYDNIDITSSQPADGITIFEPYPLNPIELEPAVEVEGPYDDEVKYNTKPGVIITPLKNNVPQAPAVCELVRPTPGITLDLDALRNVVPGDSLIINGTEITFPAVSLGDPYAVLDTLKCAKGNFTVSDTFEAGKKAVRISSCSNAPLTFRDGCRGGQYKEVLDFHVVRGFTQTVTETSNTAVIPATTGYGGYAAYDGDSTASTISSAITPSATYTLYNADGDNLGLVKSGGTNVNATTTSGHILSSKTTSGTTGGQGYEIGDRLRLVGGTPVNDPFGGIEELCVVHGGRGYSGVGTVKVYIGDGSTPGTGAEVESVRLGPNNSIESIVLKKDPNNGLSGFGFDVNNPPVVQILDTGTPGSNFVPAKVQAKIGGMKGQFGPARVAKFEVVGVSSDGLGTITALKIIDRGVYKVFPSDLTQGIPLEYDVIHFGDESGVDADGNFFAGSGLGQFDPLNDMAVLESPGAYDPIRDKAIHTSGPKEGKILGGSGARVFLTAREIPDCSEKGNARQALGLPERVTDTNFPEEITSCFNRALEGAGYDPEDIYWTYEDVNDEIGHLGIVMPGFDGVVIDETAPGFLDKLGIPIGTYNIDMLCMEAILSTPDQEPQRISAIAEGSVLADDDGVQILTSPPPVVLEISCVESVGPSYIDPDNLLGNVNVSPGQGSKSNPKNGQDPNSVFGDGNFNFITDLYQYELRTIYGEPVETSSLQKECDVLVFESKRYDTAANISVANHKKLWVDNYNNTGWAYLENGNKKYGQEALVDSKFIKNAILYNAETGEKEWDLYEYDPFKGVIPGFIEKELNFITDSDPVVYNSERSNFGKHNVGMVWWDTSNIRYQWYEQGTNRQRWINWGKAMPGSSITLYEWIESKRLPQAYNGSGKPRSINQFITEKRRDPISGEYETYYYYWVHNKKTLDNEVAISRDRVYDTFTLARYLADPIRLGLPMISYVSNESFVLHNISSLLKDDSTNLQINLSRDLNPNGTKHVAWKLLREADNNSIIPDDLSLKLIDSLCGYNSIGQVVPDPLLSNVEAYGIKFRPRQSMFKNVKEARRMLFSALNDILADIKLNSSFVDWDKTLPANRTYIETVNWYGIDRINNYDNSKVRYNDSYKPVYQVGSAKELDTLFNIPNDSIVQVKPNANSNWELWKFNSYANEFERIAMQNETIQLKSSVYTEDSNPVMANELRLLLNALKDNVFVNTEYWNKIFFTLSKYALYEQEQLDWAFKTSYIYIEKDEEDLIQFKGFKADNFEKVTNYFDEVKPYTAKIRDYKDGKKTPIEYFGTNALTDFDKPPYADSVTANVRILDDFLQSDSNILQTNNSYVDYFAYSNIAGASSPIRKTTTKLYFDRTNWKPTAHDFDPRIESVNASIAVNFVTLTAQTNAEVSANTNLRAVDRIFKFDTEVQAQLGADLNTHFGISDALSNANIITSTANITTAIDAGSLTTTLTLLKEKADGGFKGTIIDAKTFDTVVTGTDGTTEYQNVFGFDSTKYASAGFDPTILVKNYIGSFTQSPTLMVDDKLTEGFDGITFQRVLYGEERPEELALFDPYENLIIRVTTSPYQEGDTGTTPVSSNANIVKYQITMDLYGTTEYMRMLQDGSANTRITEDFLTYSDVLSVADASLLPDPIPGTPGVIWVGTERIEYERKVGNTIREFTRGTHGTTIQNWYAHDPETGGPVTVEVFDGSANHLFTKSIPGNTVDNFNPGANIWLDTGAVSLSDKGNANTSYAGSIMKFLHNL